MLTEIKIKDAKIGDVILVYKKTYFYKRSNIVKITNITDVHIVGKPLEPTYFIEYSTVFSSLHDTLKIQPEYYIGTVFYSQEASTKSSTIFFKITGEELNNFLMNFI